MISHRNVIANILQITANEMRMRKRDGEVRTEIALCALPQSHIYGLVYICQLAVYRGDQVVVLPRYNFDKTLACIAKYRINTLFLVSTLCTIANKEVFSEDGWLKTGDVAMFRVSPAGHAHLWILDRAKDLIKVKVCWLSRNHSRLR